MARSAKEVLVEARRLLTEKGWTQDDYARGHNGFSIGVTSEYASCYCVVGALMCAGYDGFILSDSFYGACGMLYTSIGVSNLCSLRRWNDSAGRKAEEVISALDSAIACCGDGHAST